MAEREDQDWQRLDKWLWCARFLKSRSDCTRLVSAGGLRINRQATDKAHARLRPGDVLTLPLHGRVRVIRVLALAIRRGPAPEARTLYEEIAEPSSCLGGESPAYPAA
jgi:ribosome-associated heat shock protein Hsp15